jgi:hypothetical protein
MAFASSELGIPKKELGEIGKKPNKFMKKSTIVMLAIGGAVCLLGMGGCTYLVGSYNKMVELRNVCDAKEKSNTAEFDGMYKKIVQSSQIPNEKAKQIKEILKAYVEGRGSNDAGQIVTMVREAVPNIQLPEYGQLMNIVTGSRDTWTRNQNELVSRVNEYNTYIDKFPRTFLAGVFGFPHKEAKVITSDKTEEAFSTGKDNDTKLF